MLGAAVSPGWNCGVDSCVDPVRHWALFVAALLVAVTGKEVVFLSGPLNSIYIHYLLLSTPKGLPSPSSLLQYLSSTSYYSFLLRLFELDKSLPCFRIFLSAKLLMLKKRYLIEFRSSFQGFAWILRSSCSDLMLTSVSFLVLVEHILQWLLEKDWMGSNFWDCI